MVTARLFLILPVLVLCVRCDNSTVKKRRGRPKKSGGEKVTTTMPTVPTPTQTTFDEYETYFDASGWWHEPRKQRPNATKKTRKRRKFETTPLPTPTTPYDILAHYSPTKHVTGRLEAMYYSLKRHYNQPGRRKEADHLVRDIIKKHDEKKGIKNEYTWVSIESKIQGDLKNSELRQYEDLKDISDL